MNFRLYFEILKHYLNICKNQIFLYYEKEKAKMANPNLIYLLYFTPTFILIYYLL